MYSERLRQRRRRKIIFSALFSLLGIGTLGTATFAWFTTVRAVNLSYTGVQVMNTDDLRISYKFYGYDEDTREGKELSFTGTEDKPPDPFLGEYDSFITDRNEHNNRIIKIDVQTIREQTEARYIQLSLECEKAFYETKEIKDAEGNIVEGNYVAPFISNIIYFRGAVTSIGDDAAGADKWYTALHKSTTANDIYTNAVAFFKNKGIKASTFVGENYDTAASITEVQKETSLTISSKNLNISLPAGTKSATFYVEYNYSSELITKFQEKNYFDDNAWGTTDILKGDSISFANDIPYMRVEYGEAASA
ncbi:MAG: hypothetical protein ACI4UT_04420 [Candidatus Enteromonas sp.]